MIERRAISESLPPEHYAFAHDLVGTGTDGSVSEVARAGLRLLREDQAGVWDRPRHPAPTSSPQEG